MTDPNLAVTQLLIDVVLPNLKTVQVSQSEQIAANDRLENAIEELRMHLESQFAHLNAQLTACASQCGHAGSPNADPLVFGLCDLVITAGQTRTRTSAIQPTGRSALHPCHCQFIRSWQ